MNPLRHGLAVSGAVTVLLLWLAPPLSSYLINSDHGYQLSLGALIGRGAFPYVDLVFHYGPMVAWSSALALWGSGSLLGETVLCAVGYAAAIGCLGGVARARLGRVAGWLVPLVAVLFLARFYKWYFWLFPAVTLVLLHRYMADESAEDGGLVAGGVSAGLCALFRFDLGIVLLVVWLAVAMFGRAGLVAPGFARRGLIAAMGFLSPLAAWLGVLAVAGGGGAVSDYFAATFDGGAGVVGFWSLSAPPFDAGAPFSSASGLRIALAVLPVVLLAGLLLGAWLSLRETGRPAREARFLAASSLLGVGMLPQAYYRADAHHLLQVLPPFLLVAPLVARTAIREAAAAPPVARSAAWAITGSLVLATLAAGVGLRSFGGSDLAPVASNGFERLGELANGLRRDDPAALAYAVRGLEATTAPDGRVLVVPMLPQVYFFAGRPMSGVLNLYAPYILDGPRWRRRNLKHVLDHPPSAVLVSAAFLQPRSQTSLSFRRSHPELNRYLRTTYREVASAHGPWLVLHRSARPADTDPSPR